MNSFGKFTAFLINRRYSLIEDNVSLKFIIYEYDGLFVKIVQERNGKRFFSLSRTNNHSWQGWYDMEVIYFLVTGAPVQDSDLLDFEHLSQFFIDYYEKIQDAFSPTNIGSTEKAITALQKERTKLMFGYDG